MALILNFKNKSTIAQLETIKMLPSFETLINIANVFAVKTDWLLGRTDEPYDDVIISRLEKQLMDNKLADNLAVRNIAPILYLDNTSRKILFLPENRAKLVFLFQFLKVVIEKHPEVLHKNMDVAFLKSLANQKRWSKKPDELYMQLQWKITVEFYG